MKRILVSMLAVISSTVLFAQSEKYVNAMQSNISMLDTALAKGNMAELSNTFERIGDAEKTQWLPYYYAAYCSVMNAYLERIKAKRMV